MHNLIRLEILTKDRLGITVEILEKVSSRRINLISMEVFYEKVCIKLEHIDDQTKNLLIQELYEIKDVLLISELELLFYEQNEKSLMAVIDSVDEGIIAIDKRFRINIFNNYCERLFNYHKNEVIGTDIRLLIGDDAPVVDLLKNGFEYDNIEFNLKNERGEIHYLTTGRAIKNDNNETIGAVASLKDINKARQLAKVVSTPEEGAFKEVVGCSQQIEKVKRITLAVAKSASTVLLRGESGTGKELFAKAIHSLSERKAKNFITINCAALPEGLLESELFGYEKGSFTGALHSGKDGLFKEASGGTLFLDEIGELSQVLQAKLLRVLQEGTIRKIGGSKEEKVDVRIIAATNKNLEAMIENKLFREDLYYRLNVIPIFIPSLKERLEDIPILVQCFVAKLNQKLKRNIRGAQLEFINGLMEYDWPGNVRELQNIVERAMNLCEGEVLTARELILDIKNHYPDPLGAGSLKPQLPLKDLIEQWESEVIAKTLQENKSYRKTAKILGVSHTTIMNKLKKYKLQA